MPIKKQTALLMLALVAAITIGCGRESATTKSAAVHYEMRTFRKILPGCPSEKDSACVVVEVGYPEITSTGQPEAKDKINQVIMSAVLVPIEKKGQVLSAEDLAQQVISTYQEIRQKSPDYRQSWLLRRVGTVQHQTGKLLSMALREETRTGGSNPNSNLMYVNFWCGTEEPIQLQDILLQGGEEKLLKSAEAHFRQLKKLGPAESLTKAGFWFDNDKFHLTQNYGLGKDAITFHYNAFEIAPLATGATSLTIPYAELSGVLREEVLIQDVAPPSR
jgi:hypothetical protein